MSEHIISDEFIKGVRDASYEAGKAGLESYIVGVEDNEEVIRCRDCAHMFEMMDGFECERRSGQYHTCEPNGFCAWAERREA